MTDSLPSFHQSSVRSRDLIAFYRWLGDRVLTVVDLETTGSSVATDRAIEVSVLQGKPGEGVLGQCTSLVDPGVPVPQQITRFTGISQRMVDGAPAAADVWPTLVPLLAEGVLTAHNLAFDYGFLQAELGRLGIPYVRPLQQQFCTVKLSRLLLAELPSRRLSDLVRHFRFDVGRSHRAAADTMACWLLAERLLLQVREMDDAALLAIFANQWIEEEEAAEILGLAIADTVTKLKDLGLRSRFSRRKGKHQFLRGEVEQVAP